MNSEQSVIKWEQDVLRRGEAKGKAEGKAEGEARGLRVAASDLCELLGIALTASRRARIEAMGVGELEALRLAIKQTRRWPATAARAKAGPCAR